uniref:Uncharacterized protein n=1 Tax=Branchiostoma floridae TaxID=7739 RepID=C3XWN2_BRAFL|eukprot:XP_002611132.1 hypothetical protein BRAFLDRAFT_88469 [Branchiostoma floridae]
MAPRAEGAADGRTKKPKTPAVPDGTAMVRGLLAETVLGFIFWSLLHGFGPMIWFYPLNELEISGYEAFVLAAFTPVLAGVGAVFSALQTRWGLALLRAAPSTLSRLVVLAMGNAAAMLVFVGTLWNKSAFQSLLFLTQAIYGEVSVVSRWVVTGYPDPGPAPNPWGSLVLLGLANGMLLSSSDWLTGNPLWFLVGGVGGAAAIQFLPTYQGFLGGVLLAVYTMSIWPQMSDRLVLCPPARTMVLTLAVYLVQMFGMVWCTAYNFVPLGEYTRERTYILLAISVLCVGAAMHLTRTHGSSLAFLNIDSAGPHNLFKKFVGPFLSIIVIGGLGGFVWRHNPQPFNHPAKTDPKEFTSLIWTFHFGYDNRGWPSFERAARMLEETGTDMLLSSSFFPTLLPTHHNLYRNLLLSKYPIVRSYNHMLPSPHGELAPAISATINISGSLVDFLTTHMGNDSATVNISGSLVDFLTTHMGNDRSVKILTLTSPHGELVPAISATVNISGSLVDFLTTHMGNDRSVKILTLTSPHGELVPAISATVNISLVDFLTTHMGNDRSVKILTITLPPHGELVPAISAIVNMAAWWTFSLRTWGTTVNISGSLVDFLTTHMGNDRSVKILTLTSPHGELVPAISAIVNISLVDFLTMHMGNDSGNPVVFLGYVTSSPGSRDYRKLLNNGGMKDIDSTDRDRWCEYIMYKKLTRLGYARVSHGGLSDTEVQMAKFRIPHDPQSYHDNGRLTTDPAEVEPQVLFTDRFGSFFRGHSYSKDHHYHMDTPKYFLP